MMLRCVCAAVAVALAGPAAAHAADYYVTKTGSNANGCTEAAPCGSAQGVAVKAFVVDGDVVHIGPGIYTGFSGRIATSKRLTFEGAGSLGCDGGAATYLDAATTTVPGIALTRGGTVRSLCVRGGFGGADEVPPAAGLALTTTDPTASYELTDVDATGGAKQTTSAEALRITDDADRQLSVNLTRGAFRTPIGGTAVLAEGENVALTGSQPTITAGEKGTGLAVGLAASGVLDQASIIDATDQSIGVRTDGAGSELTLTRSVVRARGTGVMANNPIIGGGGVSQITLETSLVIVHKLAGVIGGNALRAVASGSNRSSLITVRSSTVVIDGPGTVAALNAVTGGGGRAEIIAAGTVASATDTDGSPGDADLVADANNNGTATITATASAFEDRSALDGATVSAPGADGNVTGDKRFADPEKDNYVPLAGSVLIDRSDPSLAAPEGLDLQGLARPVDGDGDCVPIPDIGAYEGIASSTDCRPTVNLSTLPIRLDAAGTGYVVVSCPALYPRQCSGSLLVDSVAALALAPGEEPAIQTFGSGPLSLVPGTFAFVPFTASEGHRTLVRRQKKVPIQITANLTDSVYGPNTVTVLSRLLPAPRRPVAGGGLNGVTKRGKTVVRVRCQAFELAPCTGRVGLRTVRGKVVAPAVDVAVPPGSKLPFTLTVKKRYRPKRGKPRAVRVIVRASEGEGAQRAKAKSSVRALLVLRAPRH